MSEQETGFVPSGAAKRRRRRRRNLLKPLNLTVVATSGTEISLAWDPPIQNEVLEYRIYRNGTFLTTTTNSLYNDTSLSPDTAYTYHVVSVDVNLLEGVATTGVTKTLDTIPPNAPTGLIATPTSSTSIALTWDTDPDVTVWAVFRDGISRALVNTPSYNDLALSPNTQYSYYIVARDAALNISNPSNAVVVSTPT